VGKVHVTGSGAQFLDLCIGGFEFGTTTGRPRRVGWYDAPITRYATRVNGITDLVLTKLDILTGLEQIPVCVAYDVDGEHLRSAHVRGSAS
jgi:adenylosuccinate synthase